ncbi:AAA family ATPase [Haloferacaceae archaeon DSL9]
MTDAYTEPERNSRTALPVETAADLADRIVTNVERVIVGHESAIEEILVTMLAGGHLLLEDVPGVGKTMLARSISRSVDCSFKRVQFTPDLLPADVTGVNVFNQKTREFDFQPGPIFANIVLADEINRAPPKTQSALLEAMEERQVTTDGTTRTLPEPFTVIATQNDAETGRTYELPLAEIDRFTKKLHLGYPNEREETELLGRVVGEHPIDGLAPVASIDELRRAQETVSEVDVAEPVRQYLSQLVRYTRENATLGASPRGTIALMRAAQARAVLDNRGYVVPDDIQAEASSVLAHRIRPAADDQTGSDLVDRALQTVAVK